MLRLLFIIVLMSLFSVNNVNAQISRTSAMGGLTYGIVDRDFSLTPYNFGGNPAWIVKDEVETFLDITPSVQNSWGDYRRTYDSEGSINYGTAFKGVKRLEDKGTFVGFTSYNYEIVRNLYRTLRRDTYSGEAFFMIDTTKGDFRYSGPIVNLTYSWEPFDNLYAGVSGHYQILDGLKQVYTNAQSIYREVAVNVGLAYQLSYEFVIASNIKYSDFQETVEAKDVNLLEVEVFNYRGDTYFVGKRGSSVTQKLNRKKIEYAGQLFYQPSNRLSMALQTTITPQVAKVLVPQSGLIDVEEGYTDFHTIDFKFKSQYSISDAWLMGISTGYNDRKCWSNNSKKNLLLWDWDVNEIFGGIGTSYKFDFLPLLIGGEIEFSSLKADSSKYIDTRFINVTSFNNLVRFGAEYEFMTNHFIRAGINYGNNEIDLLSGGSDVKSLLLTAGFGLPVSSVLYINANIQYKKLSTTDIVDLHRSGLSTFITMRLNTF
ncbi:MAG: hypothetical protein Q8N03_10200 [Ignavibacteria bacterium]|nr:hypothetical protein [Ignavibacteria bacterium]